MQVEKIMKLKYIALLIITLTFHTKTMASQLIEGEMKVAVIDSITQDWNSWDKVSIAGKMRMAGLPLSPSVRIFMQRDSCVSVSVRAPFMGEVGRMELTDSTILIVDKMHKTYVEESTTSILARYPGRISDIQDILLGRLPIAGFGTLSVDKADAVDLYLEEDETMTLVVNESGAIPGFNYGFTIGSDFVPGAILVLPEKDALSSVMIGYDFFDSGYDLTLRYQSEKRNYSVTFELDNPVTEGAPMNPIRVNSKYRKVDPAGFLKSF